MMFPLLQLITYSFALWFGLYLLARAGRKAGPRFAGLGLVAYALGVGFDTWINLAPEAAPEFTRWRLLIALVPAVCWIGAVWHLLPRAARRALPKNPLAILLTATIFFALGIGLLIVPLEWLSSEIVLLAICGDLGLLGYAIAALDAYDEGEAFLPDFLRALGISAFIAATFSLQFVLILEIARSDLTPPLLLLWLVTLTTALLIQTFSDALQALFDRLIFARFARLRQERADLRAVASALPWLDESLDLSALDDAEFARLTRRALSHMGDWQRLAASPLTRLPLITQRLAQQGAHDNTLERAAELKTVLAESIARLKPRDKGDFGTSDEWRYYNALYFPYVMGLKPYSRRSDHDGLDSTAQAALDWFTLYVPERTLHNWQNAAAKLVAQDLREQTH
jgi:hypothetical protein